MSIEAMTAAFALQDISPTDTLVLVAIGNFANGAWECFPGRGTLVMMTKLSPRAITLAIRRLETAGYIVTEPQARANGSQMANRYVLHLGEGGAFAAPSNAPLPRRHVGEGGQPSSPLEPSLNPQKEVSGLRTRDPFDEWWALYPRKEAKVVARRAWSKATPKINKLGLAELMDRTRAFAEHVVDREKDKIAHPATWLNGERWNDELPNRSQTDGQRPTGADRAIDRSNARLDAMVEGARIAAASGRRRWTFGGS
jgi:hypothetical protein